MTIPPVTTVNIYSFYHDITLFALKTTSKLSFSDIIRKYSSRPNITIEKTVVSNL